METSSSSSPSDPAFSSRSWKHHVFLSFRGEDTRNTFVGHLHTALENMGIQTYKDDKKLSLGGEINLSLIEAIEQSQIAIIVFSENYANSTWCLNELRHIMKCRKERGLIVVPIFYGVDPSDVRKQKKKYGEAFAKYELEKNANTSSWRKSLAKASDNSGHDFKSGTIDESELIKNIVNKISKMIRPLTPRVKDNLVGIEDRMNALISKLKIGSDCVLMIGIWGVGGGGKTTLATSVYSKISWEFDCCCCIENIREQSSKVNGLEKLQRKLISGVLKQDNAWIGSIEEGKDMIMDTCSSKNVLIVLDDVDKHGQLEALVGSRDWFGKGSRIIITTRDEHLLKAHKVDVQNISLLDNYEATKLLCKCAGLDHKPIDDYEELLKEVVSYACGLPLALTVLGSFMCHRGINEWKSTLARLKKIPNDDIVGKLRISYDGLKRDEQDLFLDIACFFRGEPKDSAMPIFDACGLCPDIGLEVLREKALITISDDDVFDIHDLVQEMGHDIVRGKHLHNPEKHSRVWKTEDVITICAMDATTDLDTIEAVRFSERANPLQHRHPLIVANTKNLRWIDWEGYLSNPLLTKFPQTKLCCFILRGSMQTRLWKGYKFLPNLKAMELWDLKNLMMTPNFDGLINLESFKIYNSPWLIWIDSSFGHLEKLVFLSIQQCPNIKIFPSMNRLKNLKTLSFGWSHGLFKLSKIQQKMNNLPHDPHFDNYSGDTQVMNLLNNLKTFLFPGWPRLFDHNTCLRFYRAYLTKLDISACGLTNEDINYSEWELPHLKQLDLSFNEFSRLDFSPWRLPQLKWLGVRFCYELVGLSNLPSSIAVVDAQRCSSLEWFGDTSSCKWLWNVTTKRGYKLDPFDGERLLNSMLQGNAIEDHFISVTLPHQIPKGFVGRFFMGKAFTLPHRYYHKMVTLHLPDNWCNDFCGFLIRVVNHSDSITMDIIIKQEADEEDSRFSVWQEYEAPENEYLKIMRDMEYVSSRDIDESDGEVTTFVGYVSFRSLRQTTSLNSSYNII